MSSAVPLASQHPKLRLTALQCWRGAAVPVPRAAWPELPAAGAHQLASSWFPHPEGVLAKLFTADLALPPAQPVYSRGCAGPVAAPCNQEPCDMGTWFMPTRAFEGS